MFALILSAMLTAAGPQFEVQLLDGRAIAGSITALDTEQVTIDTTDGPTTINITKLMRISAAPQSEAPGVLPGVWIDLVDGSSLVASDYSVSEGLAQITLGDSQQVELFAKRVAAVRFQEQTPAIAAEWSRILDMKSDADLLVVRKNDTVNYHKGMVEGVDRDTVRFNLDGDVLPVKRTKVLGLVYYRRGDGTLPTTVCNLDDTDGSHWAVSSLALSKDKLKWGTPAGVTVSRSLDQISKIDFSSGKIVYLSDLSTESVKWTPYFGKDDQLPVLRKFFAPRQDSSLASKQLSLGGKQYRKGLSLHSRSEVVYRLPGRFGRFKAIVGIDDSVRPNGNVRLVISGDDRVLLEATIDGSDEPKPVDLDISGVRRLRILVDFGQRLDVADHLDLCEARIVK